MSECPSLTLSIPAAPSLSFYAATQVPGLALPVTAFEDIPASSFVHVGANGLVAARSYPPRPAHAFIRQAVTSGTSVYVQQDGLLNGLTDLTTGALYLVGTGGGLITATQPASGISQSVGIAVAADTLLVGIQPPVYLA